MPWTYFWDMHSGGGQKLKWAHIYIEAPKEEAIKVFYHRFGRNPNRVTCTCCGEDYAIDEEADLAQLTGYDRGLGTDESGNTYIEGKRSEFALSESGPRTMEEYRKDKDTLFIDAKDIKPEERKGDVPEEGYVWA